LLLSLIDTSIVATSLYSIGIDFNAAYSVKWVALTYTLAYLGCAVTFSRVSDVIGRRNAFVIAYVLFFAFSLGCGFAQNLEQLIVFRVLQGVGGSGTLVNLIRLRCLEPLLTENRTLLFVHDHPARGLSSEY
jgi:MFS family permease